MSHNNLSDYTNRQKQFEKITYVKQHPTPETVIRSPSIVKKLTKLCKVYGKAKVKAKHPINFKISLKLYKTLSKIYTNLY